MRRPILWGRGVSAERSWAGRAWEAFSLKNTFRCSTTPQRCSSRAVNRKAGPRGASFGCQAHCRTRTRYLLSTCTYVQYVLARGSRYPCCHDFPRTITAVLTTLIRPPRTFLAWLLFPSRHPRRAVAFHFSMLCTLRHCAAIFQGSFTLFHDRAPCTHPHLVNAIQA